MEAWPIPYGKEHGGRNLVCLENGETGVCTAQGGPPGQALTTACLKNQLNGVPKLILVCSSQIGDLLQYCFGTFFGIN